MTKSIYYDPNKMLSYNALLNFVVGQRGCGKTYGMKKWCIKRFMKTGEKFIYLRRYKEELNPKDLGKFFNAFEDDQDLKGFEFKVEGKKFFMNDQLIGEALPLSNQQYFKSVEFAGYNTIIFDEFIIEKGNIHYLENEPEKLLSVMDSVFRDRQNCRCVCMANSVLWANPYFAYYKFDPMAVGFQTRQDNMVVLQVYENEAFKEHRSKSRFGRLVSGTRYEEMAVENKFHDANDDFICKKPKNAELYVNLVWGRDVFGLWFDRNEYRYIVSKKHNPDVQTVCYSKKDYTPNMMLISDRSLNMNKILRRAFANGYIFYEDVYIRNTMYDLFTMIGIR